MLREVIRLSKMVTHRVPYLAQAHPKHLRSPKTRHGLRLNDRGGCAGRQLEDYQCWCVFTSGVSRLSRSDEPPLCASNPEQDQEDARQAGRAARDDRRRVEAKR